MKISFLLAVLLAAAGSSYASDPGEAALAEAMQTAQTTVRPTAQTAVDAINAIFDAGAETDGLLIHYPCSGDQRTLECDAWTASYLASYARIVANGRKVLGILPQLDPANLTRIQANRDLLHGWLGGYGMKAVETKFMTQSELKTYYGMRGDLDNIQAQLEAFEAARKQPKRKF